MNRYHGKGEEEYEDGAKEIGHWAKGQKQGYFECKNKSGALTHRKLYKDDREIKCEEVKQQI